MVSSLWYWYSLVAGFQTIPSPSTVLDRWTLSRLLLRSASSSSFLLLASSSAASLASLSLLNSRSFRARACVPLFFSASSDEARPSIHSRSSSSVLNASLSQGRYLTASVSASLRPSAHRLNSARFCNTVRMAPSQPRLKSTRSSPTTSSRLDGSESRWRGSTDRTDPDARLWREEREEMRSSSSTREAVPNTVAFFFLFAEAEASESRLPGATDWGVGEFELRRRLAPDPPPTPAPDAEGAAEELDILAAAKEAPMSRVRCGAEPESAKGEANSSSSSSSSSSCAFPSRSADAAAALGEAGSAFFSAAALGAVLLPPSRNSSNPLRISPTNLGE
mmetsp:Transcript_29061/g.86008  ORF Transcript_29061/g.86008 Transcript_29061/m.86008 type:complete len:335 (-) Transcript_29061:441-1445(-)